MLKTFLLLLSIHLLFFSSAQNIQKTYSAPGDDRGHAIIYTADGGFAIAGYTNSFGAGNNDIFLMKLDNSGTIEWQRTYGGSGSEDGTSIHLVQSENGDYILVGATTSFGATSLDAYVLSIDNTGTLLWSKKYNSPTNSEHFRGVRILANSDILLTGTDNGDNFGSADGLVVRMDNLGNIMWQNVYGGSINEHFHSSEELPNGDLLIVGSTTTYGPGTTAGYVLKIDSNGGIIWDYSYGGNGGDAFNGSALTSDNGIVLIGFSDSFGGGSQVLITKINSNGSILWSKTYGGSNYERGTSIRAIPNSPDFLVAANTQSFGLAGKEMMIMRLDGSGNIIWAKTYGTIDSDEFDTWAHGSITPTNGENFAITGWSDGLGSGTNDVVFVHSDGNGSIFCENILPSVQTVALTQNNPTGNQSPSGNVTNVASITSNAMFTEATNCVCYITPYFAQIPTLCVSDPVPTLPLTSLNGITGTWNPATITSATPGSYNFQFSPINSTCTNSTSMNVLVLASCDQTDSLIPNPIITAPNVFTPNSDSKNDYFKLNCLNSSEISLTILNRWGNVMFEETGENPIWDGKVNGIPASEGTYFYLYTVTGINEVVISGHGFFQLIYD